MKFQNLQVNTQQAEINSALSNAEIKKTTGVEIFSSIMQGKDVSKHGKNVDMVLAYMKNLGEKALNGDSKAQIEANTIRTILIQTPLLQRLNLFKFMGNVTTVGMNEELRYRVHQLQGKKSGIQANSGSFPFPTQTWRTEVMKTKTATGGIAVDYRELASLDMDAMNYANEQVITDMMNQMFYDIMFSLYSEVKNASGLKNFSEAAGITKVSVDNMVKKGRRYGNVTLMGDYSVVSQLHDFVGFKNDTASNATTVQFSEAVMEEIRKTGLIKTYNGTAVVEIPNAYNETKLNVAGDFFDTYLPEGLLFGLPTGQTSPLQIGLKSGIRTMTGQDIDTGLNVQRFDMEWGSEVIKELIPRLGLVSDSNYKVDKR